MSDFYSAWLERSKSNQKKVDEAPRVAKSKDLKWVRTPQDYQGGIDDRSRDRLYHRRQLSHASGDPGRLAYRQTFSWRRGDLCRERRRFLILDDKRYDFFPGTIFTFPIVRPISSSIPATCRWATFPGLPGTWKLTFTWASWSNWKNAAKTIPRF